MSFGGGAAAFFVGPGVPDGPEWQSPHDGPDDPAPTGAGENANRSAKPTYKYKPK